MKKLLILLSASLIFGADLTNKIRDDYNHQAALDAIRRMPHLLPKTNLVVITNGANRIIIRSTNNMASRMITVQTNK
jgi:hypothetical protein